MKHQKPVMRICISCRKTYDRKNLLKITKDHKQGIMFQMEWGDQPTFVIHQNAYQIVRLKKSFKKL